jgi:hypothetical protein
VGAWVWGERGCRVAGERGNRGRWGEGARGRGCMGAGVHGYRVAWRHGNAVARAQGCVNACGRAGRGYGRAWECRVTGMGALVGVVSQLHGCVGKRGCKCGEVWAQGSEGTGARRCTDAWRGSDGAGGCSCAEACAGGMCGCVVEWRGGGVGARWVQQGVEEPVLAWLRGCKVTCGWVDAREAPLLRLEEVGSGEITAARKRWYKGRWERVHVVAGVLGCWKAWVRRVDVKLEDYKSAGGRRMRLRIFSHSRVHLRSNAPDRHTTINQGNSPRSK